MICDELVKEAVDLYGLPAEIKPGVFSLGKDINMDVNVFYNWMSAENLVHKAESLKWKNWGKLTHLWNVFYKKTYKGTKNDRILDFGCGSCFGVFVGRKLGFKNIYPFDRNTVEYREFFMNFKVFSVWTYLHGKLPFDNNTFDSVISRLVLGNAHNIIGDGYQEMELKGEYSEDIDNENIFRSKELSRVLKPGGFIYLSNKGRYKRFKESVDRTGAIKFFDKKGIRFKSWR